MANNGECDFGNTGFCVTVKDLVTALSTPLGMALAAMAAGEKVTNNGECDFYL